MTPKEAEQKARDIVENNRGRRLLVSFIARAVLEAFEEGVLAERERQAILRNEGTWAGRGG